MNFRYRHICLAAYTIACIQLTYAQCDPDVPSFNVDLSASNDATWISPDVVREGHCCGITGSEKCIEFIVYLHPQSLGIVFDVCDGATPGGALFYQVNCGPPSPVGSILCLTGPGPHIITFCKPGNNLNKYCISSVPAPSAGEDISVLEGCDNTLYSYGFDVSTISWTSVAPGIQGQYDGLLSCTSACESTTAEGGSSFPNIIDFQVCGFPEGACSPDIVCDTIRVLNFSELEVEIAPNEPFVCFGESDAEVTASCLGGIPPYSYEWNTGDSGPTVSLGVGTFWVDVIDSTGCAYSSDTVIVTGITTPIESLAGIDQDLCVSNLPVLLNGTVSGAPSGYWIGSGGNFSGPIDQLVNSYAPSSSEIQNGEFEISLISSGADLCEIDTSTISISIQHFQGEINESIDAITCFGEANGEIQLGITGPGIPYNIAWDAAAGNASTSLVSGLDDGSYSVQITDNFGCDTNLTYEIIEPPLLEFISVQQSPVTCWGFSDGTASVSGNGGLGNYNILWSNSSNDEQVSDLASGLYTVELTDSLGCTIDTTIMISSPLPISVDESLVNASCFGYMDGSIDLQITGGTGNYNIDWSVSGASGSLIENLGDGIYSVEISDANDCMWDSVFTLHEPLELIFTEVIGDTICPGENANLSAIGVGGSGPLEIYWEQGAIMGSSHVVSPLSNSYFNVHIVDSLGCMSELDSAYVFIKTLEIDSLELFGDSICLGEEAQIFASHDQNYDVFDYTWDELPSGLGPHSVSPEETSAYILTVNDNCGNSIMDTVFVFVGEIPVFQIPTDTLKGCAPFEAIFSSGLDTSQFDFIWNFGLDNLSLDAEPTFIFEESGTHVVELDVVSNLGCVNVEPGFQTVIVYPSPEIDILVEPLSTSIAEPDVQFDDLASGNISWNWTFGDGSESSSNSVLHTYADTGVFVVNYEISNSFGCLDSSSLLVTILPSFELVIPNAFSPSANADGNGSYDKYGSTNDVFFPFTDFVKEFNMKIFNRWGELIFESFDLSVGWDGTYKSNPASQDVYIYQIYVKWLDDSEATKRGDINLFR